MQDSSPKGGRDTRDRGGVLRQFRKGVKERCLTASMPAGCWSSRLRPTGGVLNSDGFQGMEAGTVAFDIASGDAMKEGRLMSAKTLP
jgi:hypothetical protein